MNRRWIIAGVGLVLGSSLATACDLCGCYSPQLNTLPPAAKVERMHGAFGAVSEQFTHFGTLQRDGREVDDPASQRLDSSISQIIAGYGFGQRLSLQVNVPVIYRDFRRAEHEMIERDTESGLGDASLLARLLLFHTELPGSESGAARDDLTESSAPRFTASASLIAGVKFPTGDAHRLSEEFHEEDHEADGAESVPSGIHGHDLALGTGSYDGVFGGQISLRYERAFFDATAQFTLRGDGRYSYHYANDWTWSGGPGWYVVHTREANAGLQLEISGEHKDVDRFQGRAAEDTGMTSVFLGPRVVGSYGRWSGEVSAGFPVLLENTALQIVPDFRLRAGVSVSF